MYNEPGFQRPVTNMHPHGKGDTMNLQAQLIRYFEETRPWQKPELKISDVASALATNRTYLSGLLKKKQKTNFKRFVNRYRITEAKRLLDEGNDDMKMEDIAFLSGFTCYTTFFYAFRDETGVSPHEYAESRSGGNGGGRMQSAKQRYPRFRYRKI